jgi:hypothetical protein
MGDEKLLRFARACGKLSLAEEGDGGKRRVIVWRHPRAQRNSSIPVHTLFKTDKMKKKYFA